MEEVLYLKFSPQNSFYALSDCGPKFLSEPIFPLKMVGSHWPTSTTSSHPIEPPNGLKQLKMMSQWGFSQAFSLNDDKSNHFFYPNKSKPFIQTKVNLKITTCLTPWGPKPLLLIKNQSLRTPQTQYKCHNQIQNKTRTFYSESNTPSSIQESSFN